MKLNYMSQIITLYFPNFRPYGLFQGLKKVLVSRVSTKTVTFSTLEKGHVTENLEKKSDTNVLNNLDYLIIECRVAVNYFLVLSPKLACITCIFESRTNTCHNTGNQ